MRSPSPPPPAHRAGRGHTTADEQQRPGLGDRQELIGDRSLKEPIREHRGAFGQEEPLFSEDRRGDAGTDQRQLLCERPREWADRSFKSEWHGHLPGASGTTAGSAKKKKALSRMKGSGAPSSTNRVPNGGSET
jgi:hypothetical protein